VWCLAKHRDNFSFTLHVLCGSQNGPTAGLYGHG